LFELLTELITENKYKQLDVDNNAKDDYHDLPVYHRVKKLFAKLSSVIDNDFKREQELVKQVKQLCLIALKSTPTLASDIGELLIKLAQTNDDFIQLIELLKINFLPNHSYYLNYVVQRLSSLIKDSFFNDDELDIQQRFDLCEKLILTDNDGYNALLIFQYFKADLMSESTIDKEKCRQLLKQFRENKNLLVKDLALECTCSWKENERSTDGDSDSSTSE